MDVLIVDDETAIVDLLAEIVEDAGCRAVRAVNGREALLYLQQCATLPCAILIDLMMPIMDGNTFRTQQLQDPKLADIPTIAMSAGIVKPLHGTGVVFTDVVPKPFSLDYLRRYCPCFSSDDGGAAVPTSRPDPPETLRTGATEAANDER